jgi:acyl-CoA synthetase (AMP-forming)/AMP-acid ligase II
VVDDAGCALGPGAVGEIEIRGPTVMTGYFRDPDATRSTVRNGWLRTGDMARADSDGFFHIVGRRKEMILRGGENVSPLEVEQAAIAHPAVRDAAAVGLPHPIWGETVGLCVVPSAPIGEEELLAYLREHLSAFKVPTCIGFADELPRNAMGKVLRAAVRSQLASAASGKDTV